MQWYFTVSSLHFWSWYSVFLQPHLHFPLHEWKYKAVELLQWNRFSTAKTKSLDSTWWMVYTHISQLLFNTVLYVTRKFCYCSEIELVKTKQWLATCLFQWSPCGVLTWADQASTQLLSSTGQGDSYIEVQTETSLTSYCHGQNTLNLGKNDLIY